MKKTEYWESIKSHRRLEVGEILETKVGNKMCTAPFNSLYIGQYNRVAHCCVSNDAIGHTNQNKIHEIMDGEYSKNIRKQMLQQKYHEKHCYNCLKFEQSSGKQHPVRNFFKDYPFHRANVKTNGTIKKHEIQFVDLLFSNKCNFACMGCTPELSSTIADNYMDAYKSINSSPMYDNYTKGGIINWENNNDDVINFIIEHQDTIKRIHLNGGEPWMQVGVHKLLDKMLEHGLNEKIRLWTHTNGSIRKYKGVNILDDYLKHWGKNCDINLSHDLHYEKGEYVRYGMKTKKWESTLRRIQETEANVSINSSYCIFSALHIVDLYKYYRETINFQGPLGMNMWVGPQPFSAPIAQIDPNIKKQAKLQLKMLADLIEHDDNCSWNISALKGFLNTPWDEEEQQKAQVKFRNGIDAFDKARNTNFLQTFPELAGLYYLN